MPDPSTPYRAFGIGGRSLMDARADGDIITRISDFGPRQIPILPVNSPTLRITRRNGRDYKGFVTSYDGKGFRLQAPTTLDMTGKNSLTIVVSTREDADFNGFLVYNQNQANAPQTFGAFNERYAGAENQLSSRSNLPGTGVVVGANRRLQESDGAAVNGIPVYGYTRNTFWSNTEAPTTRFLLDYGDMGGTMDWNIQATGHTHLHDLQIFQWRPGIDSDLTDARIGAEMTWAASLYGGAVQVSSNATINDGIRIFYAGDSRLDGRSGSSGLGTFFNQCADLVDSTLRIKCRHYNGGVYGAMSGEGIQRVDNIIGNAAARIPSQLVTGTGTANVLVITPFAVNGMHSIPGTAAAQWGSVVALAQKFLTGCARAKASGRVIVCTETRCIRSYTSDADMVAYSNLVKANYGSLGAYTRLADLTTDRVLNNPATWNSGSNTYTEDGLHWKTAADSLVAAIVAPHIVEQVREMRTVNFRSLFPLSTR